MALATVATVTSCNNSATTEQPATAATPETTATADTTSAQAGQMAYICPMECEGSASMQPGQCPVCGMDLVKNPAPQASADSTATR